MVIGVSGEGAGIALDMVVGCLDSGQALMTMTGSGGVEAALSKMAKSGTPRIGRSWYGRYNERQDSIRCFR